jgi:FkbM family methyltransferase
VPNELSGCFIDVGANQGQSIESIRLFKPHVVIYSYEANRFIAAKLQKRYASRPNLKIRPYGLGDEEQFRTLYVPAYRRFVYDGDASFDRTSAGSLFSEQTIYWFDPSKLELRPSESETRRLDDERLEPIFIKLDVQGHEANVIRGGIETIKRCEPILMVEGFHGNDDLSTLAASLGYEEYVFDRTGLFRGSSKIAVNSMLMTRRRAATVVLSSRQRQSCLAPQPPYSI